MSSKRENCDAESANNSPAPSSHRDSASATTLRTPGLYSTMKS
jgi:hypothetical protein